MNFALIISLSSITNKIPLRNFMRAVNVAPASSSAII